VSGITVVLVSIAVRAASIAAVSIVVAVRAKRPNASYLSEESPAWSPSDRARHRHTRPTSMIACKIQNDIASDSHEMALGSRRRPAAPAPGWSPTHPARDDFFPFIVEVL
jgi:hypothetical protein